MLSDQPRTASLVNAGLIREAVDRSDDPFPQGTRYEVREGWRTGAEPARIFLGTTRMRSGGRLCA